MSPLVVGVLYSAAALAGVLILAFLLARAGRVSLDERGEHRWEARALGGGAVALFLLLVFTLPGNPWRTADVSSSAAAAAKSPPVVVTGSQFLFQVSGATPCAGKPVSVDATATDVNHGLGVYDGDRLLFQVQMMPGYTNRYVANFPHGGTYTLRCLEYCGVAHQAMRGELRVADSGSGGCG